MSGPLLDAQARRLARTELGRNVVVEAGAGTGKTTLLTDRILFLLLAGGPDGRGIDITRIVALTFTEKAAGEIKSRLSTRLQDLLAALDGAVLPDKRARDVRVWIEEARALFGRSDDELREAARRGMERMDRAMISTIHHFASFLLKLYPIEAEVDPGFEVDEGRAFDDLFDAQWALWLDRELGETPPRGDEWLGVLRLAGLSDLEALARELCRDVNRRGALGTGAAEARRLSALARRIEALCAVGPDPGGRSGIRENLARLRDHLRVLEAEISGTAGLPERLSPAAVGKSAWPKRWEGVDGRQEYEEALALAGETAAGAEALLRRALDLVLPFSDDFRARYARRGWIGYDGLLSQARRLVLERPDVRRALKGRIGAILIDEFQDTDPLQGELLLFLAEASGGEAGDWRQVRLEAGKLFVVGDPKQSIYRFRGADMSAYEGFTRLMLAQGAAKCDLQTSFRSHAGLVNPVNAVFSEMMREREGLQPPYLPIHARPDATSPRGPGVEVVLVADPEDPEAKLPLDRVRETEARWIARWLAESCVAPAPGMRVPPPGKFFRREAAVLLRSTGSLGTYLDALKDAGVPYVVEADRYFYGTQEVLDFVNLLRVLDDPDDRLSLAGLLRSPLACLEDRELYALKRFGGLTYLREPPPDVLRAASRRRLARLFRVLRSLRERAGRQPLGEFVARALRETFLVELCAAAYDREQTVSNLVKFARMAAEAGDGRGATLKEFVAEVLAAAADETKEGESPLADEHLDAVRVLTIHKAKGLEFPVVIVPNLSAPPRAGQDPPCRVDWASGSTAVSLPRAKARGVSAGLLDRLEDERGRHEVTRLLYVAMTRARERLILLGAARPGASGSFSERLASVGAWPGRLPAICARPRAGDEAEPRPAAVPDEPVDAAELSAVWRRRHAQRDAAAALPAFASPTASMRTVQRRLEHSETAGPADGWPAGLAGAERAAGGREAAALVGELCHRVLERWEFRGGGDLARVLARAAGALARLEPGADVEAASREALDILGAFLASPACRELAAAEVLGREVPFVFPRGGQTVRGTMDVLYRLDGRLWVADYKSERAVGDLAARAWRFLEQGRDYAEAASRALGERCGFRVVFLRAGESVEVPLEGDRIPHGGGMGEVDAVQRT